MTGIGAKCDEDGAWNFLSSSGQQQMQEKCVIFRKMKTKYCTDGRRQLSFAQLETLAVDSFLNVRRMADKCSLMTQIVDKCDEDGAWEFLGGDQQDAMEEHCTKFRDMKHQYCHRRRLLAKY